MYNLEGQDAWPRPERLVAVAIYACQSGILNVSATCSSVCVLN